MGETGPNDKIFLVDLVAWSKQRKGSLLVFWATLEVNFQGLVGCLHCDDVHVTCVQLKLTEIYGYEMMILS